MYKCCIYWFGVGFQLGPFWVQDAAQYTLTVAFLLKISSKSIQIFAWELLGCQKKWKCSRNSNLLSNCAVFQPNLNKAQKTSQNDQKPWENDCFLTDFLSLLDFGSKTAQFDKTCKFLELFCFL